MHKKCLATLLGAEENKVFETILGYTTGSEEDDARKALETNLWQKHVNIEVTAYHFYCRIYEYLETGSWGYKSEWYKLRAEARALWHNIENKDSSIAFLLDEVASSTSRGMPSDIKRAIKKAEKQPVIEELVEEEVPF